MMVGEERAAHDRILAYCRAGVRGSGSPVMRILRDETKAVLDDHMGGKPIAVGATWVEVLSKMPQVLVHT